MTRWQGTAGSKLAAMRGATARAASGFPARRATSLYESVFPFGIFRTTARTLSVNVCIDIFSVNLQLWRAFFLLCEFCEKHCAGRFAIRAITAEWRGFRRLFRHQARMHIFDCFLHPRVVSGVRDNLELELKTRVKALRRRVAICVDEVCDIRCLESVFPEQPLVYFDLPLVSVLPLGIERLFSVFARGFVVNDVELPLGIDPYVVDASADDEIGCGVMIFDAVAERVAPQYQIFVFERH